MTNSPNLHLAVALDGAGWHPAAWRDPTARPAELFTAGYWVDLVTRAEGGLLDFVTIDDSLALQSARRGIADDRVDQVRGRLDAVLVAARVGPATAAIGLVPTATTTHTEPFHVAKAIATVDYVTAGRAGVQVRVSATGLEASLFGRRDIADATPEERRAPGSSASAAEFFDEAADFVEVLRRLWDSWEDDAEIRDVATGRFIDRDKLHYIDFEGRWFSVKGPSVTPRPPQGQPLVTALAHVPVAYRLAARSADVVFVTPEDTTGAAAIVAEVRAHEAEIDRRDPPLRIFADLVVLLDPDARAARGRQDRLDDLAGRPLRSDAYVHTGTPGDLADLLEAWHGAGVDGFRLRPAVLPGDLDAVTDQLVPLLQARSSFRRRYEHRTLRGRLGLSRPESRYATGQRGAGAGGGRR